MNTIEYPLDPPEYHWESPIDWLLDHLQKMDHQDLWQEVCILVLALDYDTIQDLYEAEMDDDDYFARSPLPPMEPVEVAE